MEYELRPATEADQEFCFRLNESCFRPRIEEMRGWNEVAERADCASQFRTGMDSIVVVQGSAAGHFAVEEHSDRVELRMLLIAPDFQSHGIGTSLVGRVIERAQSKGLPVTLWVTDWNEGAIRFYRRLGFEVVGESWRPGKQARKLRMAIRFATA